LVRTSGIVVYPGDIIHGEKDGTTVMPRHVALQVLNACERRDPLEKYLVLRVEAGGALSGVHPPTGQTWADSRLEDAASIRAPSVPSQVAE
jgi:regulator of RNase E activity RraA